MNGRKSLLAAGLVGLPSLVVGQQRLPTTDIELLGTFVAHRGFDNLTIQLEPNERLVVRQEFDLPGGTTWVGQWQWTGCVVLASVDTVMRGKPHTEPYMWVPFAWGDRLCLADAEELLDGGVSRLLTSSMAWVKRHDWWFGDNVTDLPMPFRTASASAPPPRLYGAPVLPPMFQGLIDRISLPTRTPLRRPRRFR